jgi:hypothetical protein
MDESEATENNQDNNITRFTTNTVTVLTNEIIGGSLVVRGKASIDKDLTVSGSETVGGDLTVGGLIFGTLAGGGGGGGSSSCSNVLTVKQGTLENSSEFNSIKAAVDSITTASATNRFVVKVCPGLYIEDTITLKPFVSIIGSNSATIVEVNSPSKDVFIGAPNSSVELLTIRGATNPGKAAITYAGGNNLTSEDFTISGVIFGNNDILFKQTSTLPLFSFATMTNCTILNNATFTTGISITSDPFASLFTLDALSWIGLVNPSFSEGIFISGPQSFVIARNILLRNTGIGTGIVIQNGATVTLSGSILSTLNRGLFIPNIGTGPIIEVSDTLAITNTSEDLRIDNPLTTGSINATMSRTKVFIDPATTLSLFLLDPLVGGSSLLGDLYRGDSIESLTNVAPLLQQGSNMGVIFDSNLLSIGGVGTVNVLAGTGYLMTGTFPTDDLKYVEWNAQSVAVIANTDNYIFIDENGVAQSSAARPTYTGKILLGKARTDSGNNIVYIQQVDAEADHTASQLDDSWRNSLGNIYTSGSIVTASVTPPQLNVTNGRYFMGTHEYTPMGGNDISFITFSRGGANFNIFGPQQNVPFSYDSAPNTLTPVPVGQFAKHALYVEGDGAYETYILQYGQTLFPDLLSAQVGGIPPQPGSWTDNIVLIASIIVDDTSIVEIRDERHDLASKQVRLLE